MKKHSAPIIAAILLILPVLYVGSYVALVVPDNAHVIPDKAHADFEGWWVSSRYRVGGEWSQRFFWPLEQIDRKVRPGAWHQVRGGII